MPAESCDFRAEQKRMTDWLRAPEREQAPDVELRRLAIYRELFFNNVRDFVESAFPVLKSLLPADEWDALVRCFFAEHRCQSPYFRDISLEFRTWMDAANGEMFIARPWIQELLHYEWVELAAECAAPEPEAAAVQPAGDLLAGVPALSPFVWPLVYRWPVHELSATNPPALVAPLVPTCLLVFRDAGDEVHVLPVNPLTARLVEMLQQHAPRSGRDLLLALAVEAGYANAVTEASSDAVAGAVSDGDGGAGRARTESFVAAGAALLEDLRAQGIVLGARLAMA
ncbi:MAG: putative DNA-binding domain-containing protein [Moraxellaceae bacterium]|nr:putative DNA-binding domain-containing protein [Moraxellaceae bacterium]